MIYRGWIGSEIDNEIHDLIINHGTQLIWI